MIGFLKFFWNGLKDFLYCAENWYEKIILVVYLIGAIGGLPFFAWVNLTETETVWRALALAGAILIAVVWVFTIAWLAQEYEELDKTKV